MVSLKINHLDRLVYVIIILLFLTVFVSSTYETNVGSGTANLSVFINDTYANNLSDVALVLLNGSYGVNQNTSYSYATRTYSLNTSPYANATFFNLSIEDNYSINASIRGYYPIVSDFINLSNSGALNVTLNLTLYPDNQSPYVEIIGQPSLPNGNIYTSGPRTLTINFNVTDDLEKSEINASIFIKKNDETYSLNTSKLVESGVSDSLTISNIQDQGNYSYYVNVSDYINNSNQTINLSFFLDYSAPTFSDVNIYPLYEQNASQYINLTAFLNSTYSYLDSVSLYVNDSAEIINDSVDNYNIISDTFNWQYMIPNSSAGGNISLQFCFSDIAGFSNCTSSMNIEIKDNLTPKVFSLQPSDYFIKSADVFEFIIRTNDTSDTMPEINISFINSSGNHVLNQTNSSLEDDVYFSFITNLAQENYTLNLTVNDNFNNSIWNTSWIVIDDTPPNVTNVEVSKYSAKLDDIITIDTYVFDDYNVSLENYSVYFTTNTSINESMSYIDENHWQYNLTINDSTNQDYLINISAFDLADNIGHNDSIVLEIDNTIINVTILSPNTSHKEVFNYGDYPRNISFNYTLDEQSNTSYFLHADQKLSLPIDADYLFNKSIMFPGIQKAWVVVNDSAGNVNNDSVDFYIDMPFNTTLWQNFENFSNSNISSIQILNDSYNMHGSLINISNSSVNRTGAILINLSDGKKINVSYVDFYESELNYNFSIETENNTFEETYEHEHGAAIIDMLRLRSFGKLSFRNMSFNMTYNTTEFEEIYFCSNDYLSCSEIPNCNSTSFTGNNKCYFEKNDTTHINTSYFNDSNNYVSFLLVNDTVAPSIEVTSPSNNTIFSLPFNNGINITLNENANCYYSINGSITSREGVMFTGLDSYSDYQIPWPPYHNGEYEFNMTCNDSNGNERLYRYNYFINDTQSPSKVSSSPSYNQGFDKGTSSVDVSFVIDEYGVCVYNDTTSYFDFDTESITMSSSDNLTHTASFAMSDGQTKYVYINCKDYNDNEVGVVALRFYVSNQESSSSSTTDDTVDTGDTSSSSIDTEQDYFSESFIFSLVSSQEDISINITKDEIIAKNLFIDLNKSQSGLKITTESFSETSRLFYDTVPQVYNLYKYLQIKTNQNISLSDINNMSITFKIPELWAQKNFIENTDLVFLKYEESSKKWKEVNTTYKGLFGGFHEFVLDSEKSYLYALSYISEEEAESEKSANMTIEFKNSTVTDVDDLEEGIRKVIKKRKFSGDDVTKIVFGIVMSIFVFMFVFANRGKMVAIVKGKKKQKNNKGKQKNKLKEKGVKDLSKNATAPKPSHLEKHQLLQDRKTLPAPDKGILKKSLQTMFSNIWASGYNDTSLREILKKEWSEDLINRAYEYVKYDSEIDPGKGMVIQEHKVKNVVDELRFRINEKYGFTEDELKEKLHAKGWPYYLFDDVLESLRSEMNIPVDFTKSKMKPEFTETDEVNISSYIKLAKNKNLSIEEIREKLVNADWDEKVVEYMISKYY